MILCNYSETIMDNAGQNQYCSFMYYIFTGHVSDVEVHISVIYMVYMFSV